MGSKVEKPGSDRVNQVPFPMKSRLVAAVCAIASAAFAAAGATSTGTAAHDLDVLRTVGAAFPGPGGAFRFLDVLVAAPAMLLPFGTRVLRAGLASALVAGICAAVLVLVAERLVTAAATAITRREPPARLALAVSAVAVLTAVLAPAWQGEASAPGGAVTGALLIVLAVWLGVGEQPGWGPPAMLLLGLSASYGPFVLLASLAALAPRVVEAVRAKVRPSREAVQHAAASFVVGLVPLALGALLRRRPFVSDLALPGPMFTWVGDGAQAGSPLAFASTHVGLFLGVVCAGGAALSLYKAESRRLALPLLLVVAVGALALRVDADAGGGRVGAPVLAALAAMFVLGATMLGALVLAIARARVPFAEASAALVVVLELVLPVRSIDETSTKRDGRAAHAAAIWNDVAWGEAPPAAVVLVADRGTMRRIASARAVGAMRGDLLLVPTFDVHGREAQRALIAEPKLAPLYRDLALGVAPEELSLAQLGAQRPVLATFDPKWDRSLARHLVPIGLTSRFEPEPRGASDRKRALDAFVPSKDRLVRIAVAKKDAELAAATATLLRARAIGMAATGERDVLSRALDDLRAFAPEDAVGATLVRRIVTSKGAIDVHDLAP